LGDGVNVKVKNFNESESATCVEIAILLKISGFKTYIVVPFLSLLTVFVFPIVLSSTRAQTAYKMQHTSTSSAKVSKLSYNA
jgi:hypothetical protein